MLRNILVFILLSVPSLAQTPEFRALWVDGFNPGIRTQQEADQLVREAKANNFNALIVQVRRRADSYYLKSIEPPVEDAAYDPSFDALAYIIDVAHREGIQVHAWMNAMPVWRTNQDLPKDPRHILNQHGFNATGDDNWLTAMPDGNQQFPVGYFLDPGHPAAADYITRVYVSLVKNYAVDGIHFDYIRYPETDNTLPRGAPVGYNHAALARFRRATGRTDTPDPSDQQFIEWRRLQVTQLVRRIYLEVKAINPRLRVSAALIPWGKPPQNEKDFPNSAPMQRIFQDWNGWLREGILDMAIPMNYADEQNAQRREWFNGWIRFEKMQTHGRQLAVGLGAYMNQPQDTLAQIVRVRQPENKGRASGVSFFSYTGWTKRTTPRPEDPFEFLRQGPSGAAGVFAAPAEVPRMPWVETPRRGAVIGQIHSADTAAVDGASVQIRRKGWFPFRRSKKVITDGNGHFGFAILKPGTYQVRVKGRDARTSVTVKVGEVSTAELRLEFCCGARQPSRYFRVCSNSLRMFSAAGREQHSPGGIGAPCGQAFGWPRKEQMRSVASGDSTCSNLHACSSTSVSSCMPRLCLNSVSASRWRRITSSARLRPRSVNSTIVVPSAGIWPL
jgi:uncharacterized lipoprotein YddW (UPF0748 family)